MYGHGAGSPTPVASPKIPLRVTSATESLGALITRKIHRHHWPSSGPTSGWACVSSKLRGNEGVPRTSGESPRFPSDWPIFAHVLRPEPITDQGEDLCTFAQSPKPHGLGAG